MPPKLNYRHANAGKARKAFRTKTNVGKRKISRSMEVNFGTNRNCVCGDPKCKEIQSILAEHDPEDPRIGFCKLPLGKNKTH